MEPSKYVIAAVAWLFSILNLVNGGCRCNIQHPQAAFCNHDFVIKAMVRGVKENLAENGYKQWHAKNFNLEKDRIGRQAPKKIVISRTYNIKVIKVFKGSSKVSTKKLKTITEVMSPGSVKSCGVYLKKNQIYLLAGDSILQDLWVDGCSWVQKFKTLTRINLIGLNRKYRKNCKCTIQQCTGKGCRKQHGNCNIQQEIYSCFQNFGMCNYSRRHRKCEWKKNRAFNKCLRKQKKG